MTAYLISWKPDTENKKKGWPAESVAALAEEVSAKGSAREPWRFSRVKDVKIGERVFLVQQGRRGHAILGYGRLAGLPQKTDTRRADVEFEALVNPSSGTAYASHNELQTITSAKGVWDTNASGILLPPLIENQLTSLVVGRSPITVVPPSHDSNPDWTRDELILALDLYLKHRPNPPDKASKEIGELSEVLNRLGAKLFPPGERSASFRNANGVYMKLMNFRRFDPAYTEGGKKGLSRGAKGEEDVWNEFSSDPYRCTQIAMAILSTIEDPEIGAPPSGSESDEGIEEAAEGRLLTRKHLARERNRKLVESKRKQAKKKYGKLICEVCEFDFSVKYGQRGEGFIECHHTKPLTTLAEGAKTHINDLALVCSNCHRMIHRRKPWLSIDDLKIDLKH